MDDQTFGTLMLCLICIVPFLAGSLFTVLLQSRIKLLGPWGLLPFGGMIKTYWENRPE